MQTGGCFGQVKHAEQVRYVLGGLVQRVLYRLLLGVDLMREERVSLRARFAGAAWLLGFIGVRIPRHYQMVTR